MSRQCRQTIRTRLGSSCYCPSPPDIVFAHRKRTAYAVLFYLYTIHTAAGGVQQSCSVNQRHFWYFGCKKYIYHFAKRNCILHTQNIISHRKTPPLDSERGSFLRLLRQRKVYLIKITTIFSGTWDIPVVKIGES